MSDIQKALDELDDTINRMKRFRHRIRWTSETCLQVQAIWRHLWFAQETGGALSRSLEDDLVFGTHPLLRNLLEAVLEVLLLVTWPAPGGPTEAAARSMAWDLLRWEVRWGVRKKVRNQAPAALPGDEGHQPEDPEEAFRRHVRQVEDAGADPEPLREAWIRLRDDSSYHWTEVQGFKKRTELVRDHNPGTIGGQHVSEEKIELLTFRLEMLWSGGSYATHATPRFNLIGLSTEDDGSLEPWVRDGRSREDQVMRQATNGAAFLRHIMTLSHLLPLELEE